MAKWRRTARGERLRPRTAVIATDWCLPDEWFVRMLAAALGLRRRAQGPLPKDPRRILLVHPGGLGSFVAASPAMSAIRERFPHAEIVLLTAKSLETLYTDNGLYDRTIPWLGNGCLGVLSEIRALRAVCRHEPFDMAINLDGLLPTARLLTLASGAPITVGFAPAGGRRRYTYDIAVTPETSVGSAYACLAETLGATAPATYISPRLRCPEEEEAKNWLGISSGDNQPWIGINMNAGGFSRARAWPPEKFVVLAEMLASTWHCHVLFTGSADEDVYVGRHTKHMATASLNLAGRTSVRQLAAVLRRLRLFISNDSGPMHLAAALGVPVVGIFGPESPQRFGPTGTGAIITLWQRPSCGPCLSAFSGERRRCEKGAACVCTLGIAEVYEAAGKRLAQCQNTTKPLP